jgi:DNA-binding HxlR family transcriptional regulator
LLVEAPQRQRAIFSPASILLPLASRRENFPATWTMHILWALSHEGPMRFGVLRRHVEGISSRGLTERLRTLEEKGFVFRHYQPTIPPAVTYGITERMKDIEKVLVQLEGLSRKWQGQGAQDGAGVRRHGPGHTLSASSAKTGRGAISAMAC